MTLSLSTGAQKKRWIEGMWSDPPISFIGALCGAACSDIAIDALNERASVHVLPFRSCAAALRGAPCVPNY